MKCDMVVTSEALGHSG